jgi:DNA-binding GntR family transcriptional regulator
MSDTLNYSSLSQLVYDYLRRQMHEGHLAPGSTLNIGEIAGQLGISKTPLRDALIHLQLEGFVTILPRRGVLVNALTMAQVEHAYDSVGLIEAFIVETCIDRITPAHIARLKALNDQMIKAIEAEDFSYFFETNLRFHNTYVDTCENEPLKQFILPLKHRLYDFPRKNYIPAWELRNCGEHRQIIECIEAGDGAAAGRILKEVHWSFSAQSDFIYAFYHG